MKFLHLSDLHIGRRLGGISLMEDQLDALNQALEMASGCDAVLLAGDLYDKAQPTAEAIRAASGFLVALSRLEKPVFAISGNHDAPEQVAYCHELLGRCGVFMSPAFNGAPVRRTLCDEYGEVNVWLLPFIRPASVRPFHPDVHGYEDAVRAALSAANLDPAARNVLVAHQFVAGASVCESETRLVGGLDQVSADVFDAFDYVALGHLHSPQRLLGGRARYCGSPLKYSLSEEHQRKAALTVTLGAKGELSVEELPFRPLRDLRTARGPLADIADEALYSEDYVYAVLTDEEAPVDPLGTLRLTYPNLIGMRVHNSRTNDEAVLAESEAVEARTPLEHFSTFYAAQNNRQEPDGRRMALMRAVIEEAEARQHEAG